MLLVLHLSFVTPIEAHDIIGNHPNTYGPEKQQGNKP